MTYGYVVCPYYCIQVVTRNNTGWSRISRGFSRLMQLRRGASTGALSSEYTQEQV